MELRGADNTHRTDCAGGPGPAGPTRFVVEARGERDRRGGTALPDDLFLAVDLPIKLLTIVICALGGVAGWLIILVLHFLGIAF
jgi:hypothetical protein